MKNQLRTIVVGVESPRGEDPVLKGALELAARVGATLHVAHGFTLADPLLDAYARAGYLGPSAGEEFGRALQFALEKQVAELGTASDVRVHTAAGPAAAAIIDVSRQTGADLIALGASRYDHFPLSLLGNTVRTVLRQATAPVLMMTPGAAVIPGRILVPTDLSALSAAALELALDFPGVLSQPPPTIRTLLVIDESLLLLPLEQMLLERVAESETAKFAEAAGATAGRSDILVRKGDPAKEILAEAESWGADLVVLGTSARRGMERLLLGSVAESVLRHAPGNVLVVPPTAAPCSPRDAAEHTPEAAPVPQMPPAV